MVSVVLYLYLMHYVTEETQRVAHLGLACIVFTVAMQASPLAVVVCKLNSFFNTLFIIIFFIFYFLLYCDPGMGTGRNQLEGHNSYDICRADGMKFQTPVIINTSTVTASS